jgi:hypothetical protein
MRVIDTGSWMLIITVAFILTLWTIVVLIIAVIVPYAFQLRTPWRLVALAWVAPILPYLSRRLRS